MIGVQEHIVPCKSSGELQSCVCDRPSRPVQIIRFLSFLTFPIFITKRVSALRCYSCNRINISEPQQNSNKTGYQQLVYGWGALVMITWLLISAFKFVYPDDKAYRVTPQPGDVMLVNLYSLTGDSGDSRHPYALAKVHEVGDDKVKVKVSRWQYLREFAVLKDMLSRKDLLMSYYSSRTVEVLTADLNDLDTFKSIRRRHTQFDLEEIHRQIGFDNPVKKSPSN